MAKASLLIIAFFSLQCGKGAEPAHLEEVVPTQGIDLSWVGEYLSGDEGDNGIVLKVLESGGFEAEKFTCTSDATMSGTWASSGDWIEIFPAEMRVTRGVEEDFVTLPRMKRVLCQDENVLLPNGDEGLLQRETWRIVDVYTAGGRRVRNKFISEWIAANPLGG